MNSLFDYYERYAIKCYYSKVKLVKLKIYNVIYENIFFRFWINRVGVEIISVYNQARRTNNHIEFFHNKLRYSFGVAHPNIWVFLSKCFTTILSIFLAYFLIYIYIYYKFNHFCF